MLPVNQFSAYIKQQQLFNVGDKILLAVSGGKDSVLMVHLFKQAGLNFAIAHCNFNLRAQEADRDEQFVKDLAKQMEVSFYAKHFPTQDFAQQEGISIQMAARDLRYAWFEELRIEQGFDYIALAQHQNDAIETLLLNLVRGTGIGGMHGILPKREKLIRPLLFLTRKAIDDVVEKEQIAFVEDSSNSSSKYARNKIRLKVVPQLREINPKLEETFAENIKRFAETELLLQEVVKEKKDKLLRVTATGAEIRLADFADLKPQKLLTYELLKPFGFSSSVVDELLASLTKQTGTVFLSNTHQLVIDRDRVLVKELSQVAKECKYITEPSVCEMDDGQVLKFSVTQSLEFNASKNLAHVDAGLLSYPLMVRCWQQGDRFKPLGMNNFKKMSDFFVDSKISLLDKSSIPLVVNGNGEIIWVAGLRQDERYKITAATKKVAIFELLNGQ